jgi:protoporphyrin/coproporphyrin ferrochelatase
MSGRPILLMAYGTPDSLDAVPAYYAHIRGGRVPSEDSIANLRERYRRVGGITPLLQRTEAVRDRLARAFAAAGEPRSVYIGMKHWHPFIAETVGAMEAAGVSQATGLVLAPHYSRMSIGAYRSSLDEAQAQSVAAPAVSLVERWGSEPEFIALMAELVREALSGFTSPDVTVVFSAHSLPVRIREWDDPYERELAESSRLTAEAAGVSRWRFAWQSAGATREPWIGPDILTVLDTLAAEGVRQVLQVPIGFVADHLEVLYDIDIEAAARASELGIALRRTRLPNDDPRFISALVAIISRAEAAWAGRS